MDLEAYMQIGNLDELAKANGIDVPRLRGYRLMKDEEPISEESIKANVDSNFNYAQEGIERVLYRMFEAIADGDFQLYRTEKDELRYYEGIVRNYEGYLRYQTEMFNSYVGREDVLMIHSRMGGSTYRYENEKGEEVEYDLRVQPWYLDYCNDAFDPTYVDIYAKITKLPEKGE